MLYTLLIIDAQDIFFNTNSEAFIFGCSNEVANAKNLGSPIILLEYAGYGRTTDKILEIIGNYDNCYTITKRNDDGSKEVMKLMHKHHLPMKNIVICGGRTDCCVSSTIFGLSDYYMLSGINDYSIYVIESALFAETEEKHRQGISCMCFKKNIKIVQG